MRKRIVHIFWGLTFGGIETMLVNIANAQSALGYQVFVIIINDFYESSLINGFNDNIRVILLGRKCGTKSIGFLFKLNYNLLKIKPDYIHLHISSIFNYLMPIYRHKSCSVTLHDLPSGMVRRDTWLSHLLPNAVIDFLYKLPGNVQSIDQIPTVFSISKAVKDDLQTKYGVNSIIVHNGVLTNKFKRRVNKQSLNTFNILQVSRLEHDKKGQDLLIMAVAQLAKGHPNINLNFIGIGSSYDYLKSLTKQYGIENIVSFLGLKEQSYIAEHICDYNLFVQPSRYEGFGLTVAEAMAAEVPVLVSEGQGPAEVTCNDKYGWVFKNGDYIDLHRKIEYIICHYNEAESKANMAVEYISENYDVSITAKEYIKNYNNLTK